MAFTYRAKQTEEGSADSSDLFLLPEFSLTLQIASLMLYFTHLCISSNKHSTSLHSFEAVHAHTHSSSSRLDFLLCVCVCVCISLYNRSTFRTLISTSCSRFRKSVSRTAEVSPSYFLTLSWLSIACLHATLVRSDGNGGESLGCERRSWSVIESV